LEQLLHAASHQVFLKTWLIFVACLLARRELTIESGYANSRFGVSKVTFTIQHKEPIR
jgi:hypothetical protein